MPKKRPSQRAEASARGGGGIVLFQTTRDVGTAFDGEGEFTPGHFHTWRQGDARTSIDAGHSHRVILGRIQSNPIDGHAHTLAGIVDARGDAPFAEGPTGDFVRKSTRRDAEEV